MFGLAMFGIIGLYIFAQITAPFLGFWLAKKCGFGKRMVVFCTVGSFLLIFVPVWHKQLPAMIVFQYLKREAGTKIYKPFEQWVEENPGVLETLKDNKNIMEMKKIMKDKYPNGILYYNQYKFHISSELRTNQKQRIGWYYCSIAYIDNHILKDVDVLYDIEKKELLAEKIQVGIRFWGSSPSWYEGSGGFYTYKRHFWNNNLNGEIQ